jgi:hypothetical protein
MLRVVRMHERTAERLMRIAESPVLTNPDFAACLPTSMRTLSELTRFPSPILEGYLQNGTINVATERAQVEALLKEPKPTHGSGSELSQPVAESWTQAKPAVERMVAAMARNAEEEAEALAEEVEATEPCCSFCDRATVDHLVRNAAHTAFICWECSVQVEAILAPLREEIPGLDSNKLIEAVPEEVVAQLPPTAAEQCKTYLASLVELRNQGRFVEALIAAHKVMDNWAMADTLLAWGLSPREIQAALRDANITMHRLEGVLEPNFKRQVAVLEELAKLAT